MAFPLPRRALALAAAVGLGAIGVYFATPNPEALPSGGEFALTSSTGPLTLADLRGNVVLVYFGYASCPDVCPTSLGIWGAALGDLTPAELAHVRPLFVSLDPERDTPEEITAYAAHFHPSILGATAADDATLRDVAARYGVTWKRHGVDSAMGYVVDHTSQTVVIAPDGRVVARLPHGAPPDAIRAAIRAWLPT